MAEMFPIRNLGDWSRADDEPLGETDKRWFLELEFGIRWLYKPNRENRSPDEGSCEAAASRIAAMFGLPAAVVELAYLNESRGCISRNVISSEKNSLEEAASFLVEFTDNFDPRDKQSRGHSADTARELLKQIEPPIGRSGDMDAQDWFAGYLLFDALIGNTDRHSQNWAVEITPIGSMHLAPSFDHATSLGISNRGQKRDALLADAGRIPDFAMRATAYRFEGGRGITLVDYSSRFLAGCSETAQAFWKERIAVTDVEAATEVIAASRMSVPASRLASAIIRVNKERLRRCLNL